MDSSNIVNKTPGDPRTKIMILLAVGFLSFLVCFGYWIWRLINLSQREKNKNFKNSLWLTFFLPWAFILPIFYMSGIGVVAGLISDVSWWVYPTILFVAMDTAFLAAAIVGGFLPGKEEEKDETSNEEKIRKLERQAEEEDENDT